MGSAATFSEALRECLTALGGSRSKSEIASWINANYGTRWKPATLAGHLYGCCVNRPKGIEHHPSFPRFLMVHQNGLYELYDPEKHGKYTTAGYPADGIAASSPQPVGEVEEPEPAQSENGAAFAYESHLRDYLARNLHLLEPGLLLWSSELESVEFDVDGRRIDILAKDRTGTPLIIELKVTRGHERTVGQCLYYRAKLKTLLNAPEIRIMIVAQEISDELRLACSEIKLLKLFEYSLSMTVAPVEFDSLPPPAA